MSEDKEIIVGFPLYENCTLLDFAGATQVFGSHLGFRPIWLASKKTITTTENVTVTPNYDFEYHPPIDILFVPGGGKGVAVTMEDQVYLDFIKKTAKTTEWRGSVCTGAFLLAAAGILKNTTATTYWSQIDNLKLLKEKLNLRFPEGYPRFLFDNGKKIFTGGGVSSSIDLALKLVEIIKDKQTAQKSQLSIQYQPDPPVCAGDPAHAPDYITESLLEDQVGYTKTMKEAVEKLL